jgi:hypothetical protein
MKESVLNLDDLHQFVKLNTNKVGKLHSDFEKLKQCISKKMMYTLLINMNQENTEILLFFMRNCFSVEVLTRKGKSKWNLFRKREFLLKCIEEPETLLFKCNFDNNMIKSFCIGTVNFIDRYKNEILQEIAKQK